MIRSHPGEGLVFIGEALNMNFSKKIMFLFFATAAFVGLGNAVIPAEGVIFVRPYRSTMTTGAGVVMPTWPNVVYLKKDPQTQMKTPFSRTEIGSVLDAKVGEANVKNRVFTRGSKKIYFVSIENESEVANLPNLDKDPNNYTNIYTVLADYLKDKKGANVWDSTVLNSSAPGYDPTRIKYLDPEMIQTLFVEERYFWQGKGFHDVVGNITREAIAKAGQ